MLLRRQGEKCGRDEIDISVTALRDAIRPCAKGDGECDVVDAK